jgi:hypothetical protein
MVLLFFLDKFLLFISFAVINSSHISIPFEVQNFKYDNIQKIINYHLYKDILVKFLVGNPPQTVHLSACLGEFATFIISEDAKGYVGGTYNKSLSNSYSSLSKNDFYTFQTFSEGIMSKDNFTIEKTKSEINELEFMLATEIGGNNCYNPYCEVLTQPGILGFLLSHQRFFDENITNINFIPQLKQKKLISNYDFNFHFTTEKSGYIIIGEKPHEYDNIHYKKENFIFTKTSTVEDGLDWSLFFDNIYLGESQLDNSKHALLRIEFGMINGDYRWEDYVKEDFFNKALEEKKCFRDNTNDLGNTAYFYYCKKTTDVTKFKPFIFTINDFNYNFTLTYKDLFVEVEDKILFLMIFRLSTELIFGYPFLKKYQLIFNQDTKTIGLYTNILKDKEKSPSNSIVIYYIVIIVLGIILLSLIIVVIVCYIIRKNNKRNATELSNSPYEDDMNKNNNSLIENENKIN